MKLSIVIPIYNVKEYLSICLNSIINSIDKKNVEILLIDDGSNDGSESLVDYYDNKFNFIKGFHKTNGGLSDARNYGLIQSVGEYVIFIDSDDFVDSSKFKRILNKLNHFHGDVLLWDAQIVNKEGEFINTSENNYYSHMGLEEGKKYSGLDVVMYQLDNHNDFVTTVWLAAYNREFLISNQLWFERNLLHEDELWSIKIFLNANVIEYVKERMYLYRQRMGSIMKKKDFDKSKNILDLIYIYSSLYAYIDWKITDKNLAKIIKSNISKRYLHAMAINDISRYKYLYKRIKKCEILVNCSGTVNILRAIVLLLSAKFYVFLSRKLSNKNS